MEPFRASGKLWAATIRLSSLTASSAVETMKIIKLVIMVWILLGIAVIPMVSCRPVDSTSRPPAVKVATTADIHGQRATGCSTAAPNVVAPPRVGPTHPVLHGFAGDTGWIHAREGHVGRPYWPGGVSGVTLDPGIDLGHAEPWLIDAAYSHRLSGRQWRMVERAMGVRGRRASSLLRASRTLRSIRISRAAAEDIFPYLLRSYWHQLLERFPTLGDAPVPPSVHTALLSLAYNRGAWNPELAALHKPLMTEDWRATAAAIHAMQQDHLLDGIRRRRRVEGLLIWNSLSSETTLRACLVEPSTDARARKDPSDHAWEQPLAR